MSTEENVSVITPMVEYENETIWEDKVLIMIHNLSDVINKTISNDDYDILFLQELYDGFNQLKENIKYKYPYYTYIDCIGIGIFSKYKLENI